VTSRVLLFAVLITLGVAGPASAESWIAWEQIDNTVASVSAGIVTSTAWKLLKPFETKPECDLQVQVYVLASEDWVANQRKTAPETVEYTMRSDGAGWSVTATAKDRAGALTVSHRFLCLPSSFDPRGLLPSLLDRWGREF
jgi:hypothetical protein